MIMSPTAYPSALPALENLFTGKLVRLTAATKADRPTFIAWRDDAEYLRQLDGGPAVPAPRESYEREPASDARPHENRNEFEFAIRTLADDTLIGIGGLDAWNSNHPDCWAWIGIGNPNYRGKGYGTDAMRLLVGYAFRELNMHRVTLSVFSYNLRAMRSYEKVGFVHEVTQRAALYRDGQRYDQHMMGLLRPDWEAAR